MRMRLECDMGRQMRTQEAQRGAISNSTRSGRLAAGIRKGDAILNRAAIKVHWVLLGRQDLRDE